MNQMTVDKLQYHELKERIKAYCVSGLGRAMIDKLMPSTNLKVVQNRLRETTEAKVLLGTSGSVPFPGITNITGLIESVEKGLILEPSELTVISDFLRGCRKLKRFMEAHAFYAPTLSGYAASLAEFPTLEEEIVASIKGNRVDSTATKELKRIRRLIENLEEKIEEKLNRFLRSPENKPNIQEFFVSRRGEHYTIPIKAAAKNKVAGTIIEVSAKGSTVFMEPHAVAKYSGEMSSLRAEEAIEVYQILAALTGLVAEQLQGIRINLELVSQYDMVFAKGKYSQAIRGMEPKLNDHGFIKLVACKHPLLVSSAVPLDFEIGQVYRSLVITGPNAGGKTIVLKTIGLLTLAAMSGFHISGESGTEIAVFDRIFVDIGDNQSLENALSTFSSHMQNMAGILNGTNNNTLLLFDEIGSGTEPNEGAALAIAMLEAFYKKGAITVATTHYGEIKNYSAEHPDFMNAAMQFNQETLEPLYRLLIGKSGESNALWIANRMQVSEDVLNVAKSYMENKDYHFDKVQESKIRKPKLVVEQPEEYVEYKQGDRVRLLDYDDSGVVYEQADAFNNVKVFYKDAMMEINLRRLKLEFSAEELYPEGYDLRQIFVSFKERKFEHDMKRGSKKALKKVRKEMKMGVQENGH